MIFEVSLFQVWIFNFEFELSLFSISFENLMLPGVEIATLGAIADF